MSQLIDGYISTPRPTSNAPMAYPFRRYGDTSHATYTREYIVSLRAFQPIPYGTEDPLRPGFYLVEETQPESKQGQLCTFTRTYANVPKARVAPGSASYARPELPGSGMYRVYGSEAGGNSGLIYQPNTGNAVFSLWGRHLVATDTGFSAEATGGYYTLSCNGNTTQAIAHTATASGVASACTAGFTSLSAAGIGIGASSENGTDITLFVGGKEAGGKALPTVVHGNGTATLAGGVINRINAEVYDDHTGELTALQGPRVFSVVPITSVSVDTSGVTVSGAPVEFTISQTSSGILMQSVGGKITGGTLVLILNGIRLPVYFNGVEGWSSIEKRAYELGLCGEVQVGGSYPFYALGDGTKYGYGFGYFNLRLSERKDPTGDFTFTWGGQTISYAANASAATIDAAIRAMTAWAPFAALGGSLTVTRAVGYLDIAMTCTVPAITCDSHLTPAGVAAAMTGPRTLNLRAGLVERIITTSYPHGITSGQSAYIKAGASYFFGLKCRAVDERTLAVAVGSAGWPTALASEIGGFIAPYEPTQRKFNAKLITRYWLPGVTPGINTIDDIPPETDNVTSTQFIDAIFASGDGYVTISNSDLGEYLGPIISRTETAIRLR